MGTEPQLCQMKTVQETGGGDGLHVSVNSLNSTELYASKWLQWEICVFFNHN